MCERVTGGACGVSEKTRRVVAVAEEPIEKEDRLCLHLTHNYTRSTDAGSESETAAQGRVIQLGRVCRAA